MNEGRRLWATLTVPLAVIAVVIAAAVIGVRWFGGGDDAEEHTGSDADHVHVEQTVTAEGAAEQAMSRIFTWRPAGQESPWDSTHAAADLLTGDLARAAAQRPSPDPLPKQWLSWAESNDRIVAATEVLGADGDTTRGPATVTVSVRQRVMHPDGDVTPQPDMTAEVTVEHTSDGWKASRYQLAAQ